MCTRFAGSPSREALSLDGVAPLRLVLSGPGHIGARRERGVPFHDNVGEYAAISLSTAAARTPLQVKLPITVEGLGANATNTRCRRGGN